MNSPSLTWFLMTKDLFEDIHIFLHRLMVYLGDERKF